VQMKQDELQNAETLAAILDNDHAMKTIKDFNPYEGSDNLYSQIFSEVKNIVFDVGNEISRGQHEVLAPVRAKELAQEKILAAVRAKEDKELALQKYQETFSDSVSYSFFVKALTQKHGVDLMRELRQKYASREILEQEEPKLVRQLIEGDWSSAEFKELQVCAFSLLLTSSSLLQ
jgi:hypothetical protein